MLTGIKSAAKRLPYLKKVVAERDRYRDESRHFRAESLKYQEELSRLQGAIGNLYVPLGHFYSPYPAIADVYQNEERIFDAKPRHFSAIDLNLEEQLQLLGEFKKYYDEQPFPMAKEPRCRYYFDNPSYGYSDAIFLYCMIRHLRPKRVLEVGSGYSSCVTLDTNELFFNNQIAMTFIEPEPHVLMSVLPEADKERIEILRVKLQDVDLARFRELEPGDILFFDTSHVTKTDSEVNHFFFNILPLIKSGVYVHIHDIFYPFEYPKEWVYEGRAWNEAYLLRAFLQYNDAFKIVIFNTYLEHFYRERFQKEMPLCIKTQGGCIWLRKV